MRNLEHNAAFALYGLADNLDNAPEIIKAGGYAELRDLDFPDGQPTKDCINKTLRRLGVRVLRRRPRAAAAAPTSARPRLQRARRSWSAAGSGGRARAGRGEAMRDSDPGLMRRSA